MGHVHTMGGTLSVFHCAAKSRLKVGWFMPNPLWRSRVFNHDIDYVIQKMYNRFSPSFLNMGF